MRQTTPTRQNMAQNLPLPEAAAVAPTRARSRIVVIADDGTSATLLPRSCFAEVNIGTRFEFAGRLWEVTHYRSSSRSYVAQPLWE